MPDYSARTISSLKTPLSRYRFTKVFLDRTNDNKVFFGTWVPPRIQEYSNPIYYVVRADEIGRPDLISWRVYSDPNLFWAIALRNNISMPLIELTSGLVLTCPNLEDISRAISGADSRDLAK